MTEQQGSKFGFTQFAETWNGRLAMLGFVIGLGTEFLTGQGILSQLGIL
jgi:Chlorophyll A-B binding protein